MANIKEVALVFIILPRSNIVSQGQFNMSTSGTSPVAGVFQFSVLWLETQAKQDVTEINSERTSRRNENNLFLWE